MRIIAIVAVALLTSFIAYAQPQSVDKMGGTVGTNQSPNKATAVYGHNANGDGVVFIARNVGVDSFYIVTNGDSTYWATENNDISLLPVFGTGRVGINTVNPAATLDIAGGLRIQDLGVGILFSNADGDIVSIDTTLGGGGSGSLWEDYDSIIHTPKDVLIGDTSDLALDGSKPFWFQDTTGRGYKFNWRYGRAGMFRLGGYGVFGPTVGEVSIFTGLDENHSVLEQIIDYSPFIGSSQPPIYVIGIGDSTSDLQNSGLMRYSMNALNGGRQFNWTMDIGSTSEQNMNFSEDDGLVLSTWRTSSMDEIFRVRDTSFNTIFAVMGDGSLVGDGIAPYRRSSSPHNVSWGVSNWDVTNAGTGVAGNLKIGDGDLANQSNLGENNLLIGNSVLQNYGGSGFNYNVFIGQSTGRYVRSAIQTTIVGNLFGNNQNGLNLQASTIMGHQLGEGDSLTGISHSTLIGTFTASTHGIKTIGYSTIVGGGFNYYSTSDSSVNNVLALGNGLSANKSSVALIGQHDIREYYFGGGMRSGANTTVYLTPGSQYGSDNASGSALYLVGGLGTGDGVGGEVVIAIPGEVGSGSTVQSLSSGYASSYAFTRYGLTINGTLRINDGSAPSAGYVFTSSDGSGNGEWSPLPESYGSFDVGSLTVGSLDVTGSVTIADGTEGVDKVWMSDAAGSAQWTNPTPYTTANDSMGLTSGMHTINCLDGGASLGTFTITLPDAGTCEGKIYYIKNSGTGVITVAAESPGLIDGSATKTITVQYDVLAVQSTGYNDWIILNP